MLRDGVDVASSTTHVVEIVDGGWPPKGVLRESRLG
jgi:hypothetical protein